MGRWQPDSRERLQEAALDLYAERGFDQTTAAQIAARAGLTERTFFRHFADKREVLFGGSDLLKQRIVAGVAAAPATDGPLAAVSRGLDAAAVMLGDARANTWPPPPNAASGSHACSCATRSWPASLATTSWPRRLRACCTRAPERSDTVRSSDPPPLSTATLRVALIDPVAGGLAGRGSRRRGEAARRCPRAG